MSVCVYSVCVVLCVGSGLTTDWSPVQGVLPTVCGLRNWKSGQGPQGLSSHRQIVSATRMHCRVTGWLMTNELEGIWKDSVVTYSKLLCQHLPGWTKGKLLKTYVIIAGVPTEIRTRHKSEALQLVTIIWIGVSAFSTEGSDLLSTFYVSFNTIGSKDWNNCPNPVPFFYSRTRRRHRRNTFLTTPKFSIMIMFKKTWSKVRQKIIIETVVSEFWVLWLCKLTSSKLWYWHLQGY
jgi:hypothetical protein